MIEQPLSYKDAVFNKLHLHASRDSQGDGIGDFRGAMVKLAYLQYRPVPGSFNGGTGSLP
jgi:hypothetical protein